MHWRCSQKKSKKKGLANFSLFLGANSSSIGVTELNSDEVLECVATNDSKQDRHQQHLQVPRCDWRLSWLLTPSWGALWVDKMHRCQ